MTSPEDLTANARFADELVEKPSRDQLADEARPLALNIGCYHKKYRDLPQSAKFSPSLGVFAV